MSEQQVNQKQIVPQLKIVKAIHQLSILVISTLVVSQVNRVLRNLGSHVEKPAHDFT